MNNLLLKNGSAILCLLFLINGCSSPEKTHKKYTVEIRQMKFQPALLTVEKGDTIVWINKDVVAHDVTEEPARAWTSGPLLSDQSWSMVAEKSADYFCSIHVVMKAKITVTP